MTNAKKYYSDLAKEDKLARAEFSARGVDIMSHEEFFNPEASQKALAERFAAQEAERKARQAAKKAAKAARRAAREMGVA